MPDSISIGFRRSVRCSDGKTRTGRVIYIHPDNIFAVLEFSGIMGSWRESIFLTGPENPKDEPPRQKGNAGVAFHRHEFTPEEDQLILASGDNRKLARKLSLDINSIRSHRKILEQRAQA